MIQISLTRDPNDLMDNKAALAQVMAWHRTGDKSLPELMLTQFTGADMRHQGEMSFNGVCSLAAITRTTVLDTNQYK